MTSTSDIQEFKWRLNQERSQEFVLSLQNEENPNSERENLINLISMALNRLSDLEIMFASETIDGKDTCLGCFANAIRDEANLRNVLTLFDYYREVSNDAIDDHDPS